MKLLELNANIRKDVGNGAARALRRQGMIPAVFYGPGTDSVLLTINSGDLEKVLKINNSSQVLVNLNVKNGDSYTKPSMIKELQRHPVSQEYLHIDFYEIDMDRKITVKVPVVPFGSAKGVELGGILQIIRREMEILCLPSDIPEAIRVDVTDLDIGDSLHVKDITQEGSFEFQEDENSTIITLVSPKVEVEEEEEEIGEEGEEETEETQEKADDDSAKTED